MLNKRKTGKNGDPITSDPAPASTPVQPEAPQTGARSSKTVIGKQISVDGTICGGEDLIIEGRLKGKVELDKHHVTVGNSGQVEAEILADNVTVSGRLAGNIHASGRVEITRQADFCGEIKASSIAIEDGAYLKATIELERAATSATGRPSEPAPAGGRAPAATPRDPAASRKDN